MIAQDLTDLRHTARLYKFSSYTEFVERSLHGAWSENYYRESRDTEPAEFFGETWENVQKIAPTGDIEGARTLTSHIIKEANKIMSDVPRLDPVYREEGGIWIDVSRYLSGEPEVWGDMVCQGETRKARHLSFALVAGVTSGFKAKDYLKTARAVAGCLVGLKASGYSLSVDILYETRGTSSHYGYCTMSFPLLTASGGFDVAKLAAVMSPWFHRRIKFGVMETLPDETSSGYGTSELHMNQKKAETVTGKKDVHVVVLQSLIGCGQEAIKEAMMPKEVVR